MQFKLIQHLLNDEDYPFSGMLFCGECGDLFSWVIWSTHGRRQVVWHCITRMQAGVNTCGSRYVDEESLQAMMVKAFFNILAGPVETYDESYVRRLLNRIMVHENRLVFTFKDGKVNILKE